MAEHRSWHGVGRVGWIVLLGSVSGATGGCASAAARAPAGAGAAIYTSDQGATSLVGGTLDRAARATRRAFDDLGIGTTEVETRHDERDFTGSKGDLEVKAKLKVVSGGTQIDVSARKNAVEWDKQSARQVLARIVSRNG
jgi:hypothetical protein